jgi:hypothetical protein
VQLALGQIHGALHHAVSQGREWLPERQEDDVTAADLEAAYHEVCPEFGVVQAALNGAEYDRPLRDVGFAGAQGAAKLKGLFSRIRRFCDQSGRNAGSFVQRMVPALRWSGTILGSVAMALQREAGNFPGAASAIEAIREFVEVVLNAAESTSRPTAETTKNRGQ